MKIEDGKPFTPFSGGDYQVQSNYSVFKDNISYAQTAKNSNMQPAKLPFGLDFDKTH